MEIKKNPNVDLSKDRIVFRTLGYVFVFAIVIVLFSFTTFKKKVAQKKQTAKNITTETIVNTVRQQTAAPPPPSATTVINLVDDNSTTETDLTDVNFENTTPIPEIEITLGGGDDGPKIEEEVFNSADVEEQPMYGSSDEELYTFLGENLVYPEAAQANGITATVWVTFIIEKDGKVSNIKTDNKEDPELEAEAKRIIGLTSGNWTPAKYKKKAVKMICKIPIDFVLE